MVYVSVRTAYMSRHRAIVSVVSPVRSNPLVLVGAQIVSFDEFADAHPLGCYSSLTSRRVARNPDHQAYGAVKVTFRCLVVRTGPHMQKMS